MSQSGHAMTQAGNSQERRRLAKPERRKPDRHEDYGFRERCSDGCIGHENEVHAKLTVATAIVNGQETAVSQPDAKRAARQAEQLTATPRT